MRQCSLSHFWFWLVSYFRCRVIFESAILLARNKPEETVEKHAKETCAATSSELTPITNAVRELTPKVVKKTKNEYINLFFSKANLKISSIGISLILVTGYVNFTHDIYELQQLYHFQFLTLPSLLEYMQWLLCFLGESLLRYFYTG